MFRKGEMTRKPEVELDPLLFSFSICYPFPMVPQTCFLGSVCRGLCLPLPGSGLFTVASCYSTFAHLWLCLAYRASNSRWLVCTWTFALWISFVKYFRDPGLLVLHSHMKSPILGFRFKINCSRRGEHGSACVYWTCICDAKVDQLVRLWYGSFGPV